MAEFSSQFDHKISLEEGSDLTKRYRDSVTDGSILGGLFGKNDVVSLLNQSNCAGVRIYFAIDDTSKPCFVLVGADADGNDLVNGLVLDKSFPCPNMCGSSNDLNSD